MNNLPGWVAKVTSAWVAIGSLLIVLGAQGLNLPEFVTSLFSQEFVDATMIVVGAVVTYYQYLRSVFVKEKAGSEVQMLSAGQKRKFALNPFRIKL